MYIYDLIIDNTSFTAVFIDHFEACTFLDECDRDGEIVVVKGYHQVTPQELLAHPDFQRGLALESAQAVIKQYLTA